MSASSGEPSKGATDVAQNATAASKTGEPAKAPLKPQNPALKAMGLPRMRLPSRNWMIFWTLSGSLASAYYYDRWQAKRVREKWCRLVAPIANEPLDAMSLPRTITIYLSAPPGDGLRAAREHFHSYIKPILVASAINWDVIEGRKEGDVRYKTAQNIRDRRKTTGEVTDAPLGEDAIATIRAGLGVETYAGVAGDLVIGRHTWKEYIRGIQEGWLGPIDMPPDHPESEAFPKPAPKEAEKPLPTSSETPVSSLDSVVGHTPAGESTLEEPAPTEATPQIEEVKDEEKKDNKKEVEKPKPKFPPPFMTPDLFNEATLPRTIPEQFDPAAPVSCPHILGFRNTHIRFYRWLTHRHTADQIGRQVASAVLGNSRPFSTTSHDSDSSPAVEGESTLEQTQVLKQEERDWWKTVRAPRKEHEESVLIEPMVLSEQIASRMRLFELSAEDEDRSKLPPPPPPAEVE